MPWLRVCAENRPLATAPAGSDRASRLSGGTADREGGRRLLAGSIQRPVVSGLFQAGPRAAGDAPAGGRRGDGACRLPTGPVAALDRLAGTACPAATSCLDPAPTPANLKRVGALSSYSALQVDDHFFARPPVALSSLKASLAPRQL